MAEFSVPFRWLLLTTLACPRAAYADDLPSIDTLVDAAQRWSIESSDADLQVQEANALLAQARARLLPSLSVNVGYTRNQRETVVQVPDGPTAFETATITPFDQLDLSATVTVPLVDLGSWASREAALRSRASAVSGQLSTDIAVEIAVVDSWFDIAAATQARAIAERTLVAALRTEADAQARVAAELANPLDAVRATATVSSLRQSVAEAIYLESVARQVLHTLTGIEASGDALPPEATLEAEAPLETWLDAVDEVPSVEAANAAVRVLLSQELAARRSIVPTVSAFASERISNASGFGENNNWSVGVQASWVGDLGHRGRVEAGCDQHP